MVRIQMKGGTAISAGSDTTVSSEHEAQDKSLQLYLIPFTLLHVFGLMHYYTLISHNMDQPDPHNELSSVQIMLPKGVKMFPSWAETCHIIRHVAIAHRLRQRSLRTCLSCALAHTHARVHTFSYLSSQSGSSQVGS